MDRAQLPEVVLRGRIHLIEQVEGSRRFRLGLGEGTLAGGRGRPRTRTAPPA